ncbi:hypothetical protein Lal_00026853 [Lupinus albus]|nr:hypothetical protein Lal_00026853 [Lupinus albus]
MVHLGGATVEREMGRKKMKIRTAPSENPSADPPTQQRSSFHAQSSSSASMPSNQMVMNELFSLRGYKIGEI